MGAPLVTLSQRAKRSLSSASAAAVFRSTSARAAPVALAHAPASNDRRAAAMAASASWAPPNAKLPTAAPVAGSRRS